MTEQEFMRLICSVERNAHPSLLDCPLEQAPFDSLDLLVLRSALEQRLQRNLSDEKFSPRSTLRDLYRLVSE